MGLSVSTVTNSIAALSVSGVTIKDVDEMLDEVIVRESGTLMLAPEFFRDPVVERMDISKQKTNVSYTLVYRFFYLPVGAERGLSEIFQGLVDTTMLICDAIIANHAITGCIDMELEGVGAFGIVTDPTETEFFGTDISVRILEYED